MRNCESFRTSKYDSRHHLLYQTQNEDHNKQKGVENALLHVYQDVG